MTLVNSGHDLYVGFARYVVEYTRYVAAPSAASGRSGTMGRGEQTPTGGTR
jgi:hypothetical protein